MHDVGPSEVATADSMLMRIWMIHFAVFFFMFFPKLAGEFEIFLSRITMNCHELLCLALKNLDFL